MKYFIHEGDRVQITYNHSFYWGPALEYLGQNTTNVIDATVLHVPSDTGDVWYFDDGETTFAQNPMSSNLDKIVLLEQK